MLCSVEWHPTCASKPARNVPQQYLKGHGRRRFATATGVYAGTQGRSTVAGPRQVGGGEEFELCRNGLVVLGRSEVEMRNSKLKGCRGAALRVAGGSKVNLKGYDPAVHT